MFFEGKEKTSSIRCQCPPGGQSTLKFLYDDAQPDKCNFKKHPNSKNNFNIVTLESKENTQIIGNNPEKSHKRTNYNCGKEQYNMFHNRFPKEVKQSKKRTNYTSGNEQYNIFHNTFPEEGPKSSIKTDYEIGNERCNIFHNQFPEGGKQSSIKVTQNPGGNSHLKFNQEQ